jgi:hypothetical protein
MLKDLVSKPVLDYFTACCVTRMLPVQWREAERERENCVVHFRVVSTAAFHKLVGREVFEM